MDEGILEGPGEEMIRKVLAGEKILLKFIFAFVGRLDILPDKVFHEDFDGGRYLIEFYVSWRSPRWSERLVYYPDPSRSKLCNEQRKYGWVLGDLRPRSKE